MTILACIVVGKPFLFLFAFITIFLLFLFDPERRESARKRTVALAMALVGIYPQYRSCRFRALILRFLTFI